MKAIISTTYSDTYLYFLPIVTFCWNKLGVDVICFMPLRSLPFNNGERLNLIQETLNVIDAKCEFKLFDAPEHKEATYAQCSRLYGACLDLPEDETLFIGDVDMAIFKLPPYEKNGFTIFGADLVPVGQYPMCYISASVRSWRVLLKRVKTYQEHLDSLLGDIECESFRGNYWGKDQETAYNLIHPHKEFFKEINRARPNTQFAGHRVDRDDINWRSYVSDELIDAHFWRPGYTDGNFANIMELMKMKFPNEDFQWLIDYTNEYKKLIQ